MQYPRRILGYLFNRETYKSVVDQNRASLVYSITVYISFAFSFYAFGVPHWEYEGQLLNLWELANTTNYGIGLLFLAVYGLGIAAVYNVNQERLEVGSWLLLAQWFLAGPLLNLYAHPSILALGLPLAQWVMTAVLIKRETGLFVITAASIVFIWVGGYVRFDGIDTEQAGLMSINIASIGIILLLFLRFFRESMSASVTTALDERLKVNDVFKYMTEMVTQQLPSSTLAYRICEKTSERFEEVDTARLYLVNEAKAEATLLADSNQPDMSLESKTHYGVGGLSAIGQVTLQGRSLVERVENSNRMRGVFPLRIGTRITGALEVNTTERKLFESETAINAFESLAEKIALVLDNVLQVENTAQQLKSNEAELNEVKLQLVDVQRLNQRLTSSVWSQHFSDLEDGIGLSVDFVNDQAERAAPWTPTLSQALKNNQVVQAHHDDIQVVSVPLRVRGQVIGAMEFELDSQSNFTEEDLTLLQEVSERFGMAAENTRLLEDSQRAAQREAIVNQISAKLQTATGVNSTLTEAARGLREALKAGKVAIRLGKPAEGDTSA